MKFLLIIIFVFLYTANTNGQSSEIDDLQLISSHQEHTLASERKPTFQFLGRSALSKYNPVSLTLSGLMYVYQRSISNTLTSRCIYHPSCSNFGRQAINEKGFTIGIILTTDRISRCNKLAATDLDLIRFDQKRQRFQDELIRYK